jgi:hypothetical protein
MKVIFKDSMTEKIAQKIKEANQIGLKIDYIILNQYEYEELKREHGIFFSLEKYDKLFGYKFKVEHDA